MEQFLQVPSACIAASASVAVPRIPGNSPRAGRMPVQPRSATKKRQAASPNTVKQALDYKARMKEQPVAEYMLHVERCV
eukprot:656924-Amphidinium_carterae.2